MVCLWPPEEKCFCTLYAPPVLLQNILLLLGSVVVWETDEIHNADSRYEGYGQLCSPLIFLAALRALSGTM